METNQVFTQEEIFHALKLYLSAEFKTSKFEEEDIQELDGMCLRKSAIRTALTSLVEQGF